jgi:hypothetical protein
MEGAGWEGEAAVVGEVDDHAAARGVVAGGGGAGLGAVGGRAMTAGAQEYVPILFLQLRAVWGRFGVALIVAPSAR